MGHLVWVVLVSFPVRSIRGLEKLLKGPLLSSKRCLCLWGLENDVLFIYLFCSFGLARLTPINGRWLLEAWDTHQNINKLWFSYYKACNICGKWWVGLSLGGFEFWNFLLNFLPLSCHHGYPLISHTWVEVSATMESSYIIWLRA